MGGLSDRAANARGGRRHRRSDRLAHARQSRLAVADAAQRLAVLLQAGIAPTDAWRHLAAAEADVEERPAVGHGAPPGAGVESWIEPAGRIVRRAADGASVAAAIGREGGEWSALAHAWRVAEGAGAPLAASLRGFAQSLRDAAETIDDVRVALAEPASSARVMLWLPVAGVVLGAALGFDTLTVLTTDPIGVVCAVVGVALLVGARTWTAVLVRRAQPPPGIPGLGADLWAIALAGGLSVDRARTLVDGDGERDREAAPSGGASRRGDASSTRPTSSDDVRIDAVLALSRRAGVPAAELLRAEAADARRQARTRGRTAAARLSSRLLLPLGICTLPAFLLLGVLPLLLSILRGTGVQLF